MLTSTEIRRRFLAYFERQGHTVIPSASLVPENDPSVLFNTAGMQPLVPYLLGETHPTGATRLADSQKCVRTVDIDEIGDNTHATFFEMLGNWSLGDYFKREAITWSYEFLTSKEVGLGLDPQRLYVTVFGGNSDAPRDDEAYAIWKELFEQAGVSGERIYFMTTTPSGKEPNWWSAGENGPCGPDTEMFYDVTGKLNAGMTKEEYMAADDRQEVVEIWNDVFMEYLKQGGKVTGKLAKQNVDTGSGLERVVMVVQGKTNIFETDLLAPIVQKITTLSAAADTRNTRIIADHLRTGTFLIGDGVLPSNTDQGYILRRLLRRAILCAKRIDMHEPLTTIVPTVLAIYKEAYPALLEQEAHINATITEEEQRFRRTLENGMREIEKKVQQSSAALQTFSLSASDLFDLYQTHGFPVEMSIEEIDRVRIANGGTPIPADVAEHFVDQFKEEMKKHQDISRQGSEQKFKGGLADHSEMSVRYHTATHLLHKALRTVLGPNATQKGSNITSERLRFDFAHPSKMTDEEKKAVEDMVNAQIAAALPVTFEDVLISEAEQRGAIGLFEEKYGERVRIYQIGTPDHIFSLELCGGPHVTNTRELGHFSIVKEEAVAQGVRRIKAVLSSDGL